jgi:predicted XRE-type DNA-binding protein
MESRPEREQTMSETITIEQGSGNVFADLGYPNAEEMLTKARLAQRITEVLEKKRLTQIQAAQLLGIDQPKVSKLLRGQLREFSTERLFRFLTALDQDVEIVIRRKPRSRRHARVSVIPSLSRSSQSK